ncbi:RNA-directed DNA polymerase [Hibiscus syriacus]|uniref:RNA-directed DNA polymerase n=1 Tax=Hibiscus syriacus TaxID=106335 RepID=A0A6A2Y0U6_HIBSY|nr:protein Daple-like [Hibiscus syriacus]KAE8661184.1 RNA-directed DNA polymerase [Hibiscus syriacus]
MEDLDFFKNVLLSDDDENDWGSKSQGPQWELSQLSRWPQSNIKPGTSNEVVPNQTNASTTQASHSLTISNPCLSKRNLSSSLESERAVKKNKDKAYRERCKNQKVEMQFHLEMLTGENESLKKENVSLKENNALMNKTLIDQAKEIDRLRTDFFQLKHKNDKQNVLVQTLSELLADPVRLENEKLKDENAALRKNVDLNSHLTQLVEENAELRTENKVLKVQNDALCGKIISDNEKKQEQITLN